MSLRNVALVLLLAGFVLSVAGCAGGKVSKSNFDKVKTGMTVAEVEKILGKGVEETKKAEGPLAAALAGKAKIITWTDGGKSIIVTFLNDKVTLKAHQGL